jgi:uncharacterized protein (TIGR03435 family)
MKLSLFNDRQLRELMDRSFGPYRKPDHAKAACESVLTRLQRAETSEAEDVATARGNRRFHLLLVAAVLTTMALGLYAAQRRGLLRATPPVSPPVETRVVSSLNPVPAPESAAVPAVPRTSRQPGRTAAEEIALLQSTDSGARRLQFAVASVRRGESAHGTPGTFNCGGIDGQVFPTGQALPAPQGRCISDKQSLDSVIAMAFQVSRMNPWAGSDQIVVGIPEKLQVGTYFQIQAVAENPSSVTKAELLQMLQNLLMDRFKLRIHREIRQMDGYVLTVAKSGIKFKETSEPGQRMLLTTSYGMGGNVTMAVLAMHLEAYTLPAMTGQQFIRLPGAGGPEPLHVPVDDRTGLKGVYAISVNVARMPVPALGGGGGRNSVGSRTEYDPPLPKAFEEQLGLVLTRGKVPVEYIVVDHMEEPTEN